MQFQVAFVHLVKRVRISVELSDATDGNALWNNKYDRILEDIFDVQDEIVRKISIALLGEIEISSLERANRKPTENLTSYELLLRGKVLHHKFKREACLEAIDSFNKAIKLIIIMVRHMLGRLAQ